MFLSWKMILNNEIPNVVFDKCNKIHSKSIISHWQYIFSDCSLVCQSKCLFFVLSGLRLHNLDLKNYSNVLNCFLGKKILCVSCAKYNLNLKYNYIFVKNVSSNILIISACNLFNYFIVLLSDYIQEIFCEINSFQAILSITKNLCLFTFQSTYETVIL